MILEFHNSSKSSVSAFKNLMLDTGGLVTVESATLPVATYSKFQPLSKVHCHGNLSLILEYLSNLIQTRTSWT